MEPVVLVLMTELELHLRYFRHRLLATRYADRRDGEHTIKLSLDDALVVPGETD